MKNFILLFVISLFYFQALSQQPCTFTNAAGCACEDTTLNDCDLLPDITISWEAGLNGHTEYAQTGNGSNNGRLRIDGNTPNIGWGPLNMRGIDEYGYKWYICYDAITGSADTFSTDSYWLSFPDFFEGSVIALSSIEDPSVIFVIIILPILYMLSLILRTMAIVWLLSILFSCLILA